jgi:hypothetical protein
MYPDNPEDVYAVEKLCEIIYGDCQLFDKSIVG